MDQRSRATPRAAQRRHGRALDARPRVVPAVCGASRVARRGDEPRVAPEEGSRVPKEIDARIATCRAEQTENRAQSGILVVVTGAIPEVSIWREMAIHTISCGQKTGVPPTVVSFRQI